ncbi:bifunctional 4-hydroxy-2-oxoglutarate aldolase/2-dehydro-3-deoxy-phosphogluconate aldolase [Streptacidiphilus sp. MAP5-3]|uniref:bifunctional 4-hydroxy-2-oxoglutarate aldolase/2-dehydro-3-deoxy-phosphogluconate aldolase n=1 Tax=unclassified Streptacidiphilus TaxID=2643834 RepID=UPI003517EDB8
MTTDVYDLLAQDRVLAIVRYRDGAHTLDALRALAAGGVRLAEVTATTPGWLDAIGAATDAGLVVGGGTVTTPAQVRDVAAAGGRFVVSPGLDADVVTAALRAGLEPLPGVFTGTEVLAATRAGARLLKLFPANTLGPAHLAQLRAPFPATAFVPTGGITLGDIGTWLEAGAFAVAVGAHLVGRTAPADPSALRDLTQRAAHARATANPERGTHAGTSALRHLTVRAAPARATANPEGGASC